MSNFRIEDPSDRNKWIDLPKPIFRKVHDFTETSARYEHFSYSISEVNHASFIMLTILSCDKKWEWVAIEALGALVQYRLNENPNLIIKSMNDRNAILMDYTIQTVIMHPQG